MLQIWRVFVPFLAGVLKLKKRWIAPLIMVAIQLIAQIAGGEPWADFIGNEDPLILLFGLPVFFVMLLPGYGFRYCCDVALPRQSHNRA